MNCTQTLNNLPHLVIAEDAKTKDSVSDGVSRRAVLEHLRSCEGCQRDYETLWNTASMLENVAPPAPPPELLGNIQQRIRECHQQQRVSFFANPLVWCLDRLRLDFSPRVVNATALLFFLVASGFIMKLAFFSNPPAPESGLIAMKKTMLQNIKISTSPWAGLKDVETATENQQSIIAAQNERNHFFSPARLSSTLWHTDIVSANGQTGKTGIDGYSRDTTAEKLTVVWNQIKTEL